MIAGRVPDVDASRIRPIVAALDRALASVRAQHPGYSISVTSLSAIAARNSAAMIEKLNRGLTSKSYSSQRLSALRSDRWW